MLALGLVGVWDDAAGFGFLAGVRVGSVAAGGLKSWASDALPFGGLTGESFLVLALGLVGVWGDAASFGLLAGVSMSEANSSSPMSTYITAEVLGDEADVEGDEEDMEREDEDEPEGDDGLRGEIGGGQISATSMASVEVFS